MRNVVTHSFDYLKGLFAGSLGYGVACFPIVAQSAIIPQGVLIVGELAKIIVAACTAFYLVVKTVSIIRNNRVQKSDEKDS